MAVPKVAVAVNDFYSHNGLDRSVHLVMPVGPSMTRQEFAEECDINFVMAKYQRDGILPPPPNREPMYVDFTSMPSDLLGTMKIVHDAEAAFMSLPAKVRREFENDPFEFAEFAAEPGNLDQLREWGLAPPVAVEAFVPVPPYAPPDDPKGRPAVPPVAPAAPGELKAGELKAPPKHSST